VKNSRAYSCYASGDFNGGSSSTFNGTSLVQTSIELSAPVIWISINYRLNFLGFPAGHEADAHGALNLGLKDQRLAMEWIQKEIQNFGGDPDKVLRSQPELEHKLTQGDGYRLLWLASHQEPTVSHTNLWHMVAMELQATYSEVPSWNQVQRQALHPSRFQNSTCGKISMIKSST
jgi:hypothetical protein